jgi:hypothetical protein
LKVAGWSGRLFLKSKANAKISIIAAIRAARQLKVPFLKADLKRLANFFKLKLDFKIRLANSSHKVNYMVEPILEAILIARPFILAIRKNVW